MLFIKYFNPKYLFWLTLPDGSLTLGQYVISLTRRRNFRKFNLTAGCCHDNGILHPIAFRNVLQWTSSFDWKFDTFCLSSKLSFEVCAPTTKDVHLWLSAQQLQLLAFVRSMAWQACLTVIKQSICIFTTYSIFYLKLISPLFTVMIMCKIWNLKLHIDFTIRFWQSCLAVTMGLGVWIYCK